MGTLYLFYAGCLQLYTGNTHISSVYNAAAVLWLQLKVHILLFPMLNVLHFHSNTFQSNCAVSNMAVVYSLDVLSRYAAQVLTERVRDVSSYDYYNCHYRCLLIQLLYCLINDLSILLFVLLAAYVC